MVFLICFKASIRALQRAKKILPKDVVIKIRPALLKVNEVKLDHNKEYVIFSKYGDEPILTRKELYENIYGNISSNYWGSSLTKNDWWVLFGPKKYVLD